MRAPLAAVLFAALPAFAAAPRSFELPGLLTWVEVPGELAADGIPVKLQAAVSSWKMKDLAQYYMDQFQKAGLYVAKDTEQLDTGMANPHLTALDPAERISYTVIFQPGKGGTTTVILGTSMLGIRQPAGADFAPVFPGVGKVVRSNVEGMRSMVYGVAAQPAEVHQFYSETLKATGFSEQENHTFLRSGEQLQVEARAQKDGRTTVMVSQRRRAPARTAP